MFGIDIATFLFLSIGGAALVIYGAAFGDPRPYRARWHRK